MGNLALIPSRNRKIYLAFFISIIFALSCLYLEIDLLEMILGFPTFVSFFIHKFIPPDFSNIAQYAPAVGETILFAVRFPSPLMVCAPARNWLAAMTWLAVPGV
jgi:ABC-type phosphate/phosphonate transport system permease subunit